MVFRTDNADDYTTAQNVLELARSMFYLSNEIDELRRRLDALDRGREGVDPSSWPRPSPHSLAPSSAPPGAPAARRQEGAEVSTPTLAEIALRLANAGPQWRPTADAIAAELTADMRKLYPKAPEGVPENYARGMIAQALRMAARARAASGRDDPPQGPIAA